MLSGVLIGTNDIADAGQSYDAMLATLAMISVYPDLKERGYGGTDGGAEMDCVIFVQKITAPRRATLTVID